MLHDLLARLKAAVIGAVLLAAAAGVAVVAAGYGAYAGLKLVVSAPAAAGLTALIFAILAGLIGIALMQVLKPAHPPARHAAARHGANPVLEGGVALIGVLADMALARRIKREQEARRSRKGRR